MGKASVGKNPHKGSTAKTAQYAVEDAVRGAKRPRANPIGRPIFYKVMK